eukprot:sb/3475958/
MVQTILQLFCVLSVTAERYKRERGSRYVEKWGGVTRFLNGKREREQSEPTDTSKQPIRTRYLGHVTGYISQSGTSITRFGRSLIKTNTDLCNPHMCYDKDLCTHTVNRYSGMSENFPDSES